MDRNKLHEDRDSVIPYITVSPGPTTVAGPSVPGSHWSQSDPKAQSPITGISTLWDWSTTAPSVLCAPLPWHLLDASDPPGAPFLSLLIFSLSKDSLMALPPTCRLPARHQLPIPCSSNSTCQTCHFLTKPTPAPSPEFLLSDGGPTVHPTVTQRENCTYQP